MPLHTLHPAPHYHFLFDYRVLLTTVKQFPYLAPVWHRLPSSVLKVFLDGALERKSW
jgi:hypothetical protein